MSDHPRPLLSLGRVEFYDDAKIRATGGQEGQAVYHVDGYPYHHGPGEWEITQPFHRGPFAQIADASGLKWPVWGWDGNREAPTLTPSFLFESVVRIHLHLRAGRIVLLDDSTVDLRPLDPGGVPS